VIFSIHFPVAATIDDISVFVIPLAGYKSELLDKEIKEIPLLDESSREKLFSRSSSDEKVVTDSSEIEEFNIKSLEPNENINTVWQEVEELEQKQLLPTAKIASATEEVKVIPEPQPQLSDSNTENPKNSVAVVLEPENDAQVTDPVKEVKNEPVVTKEQ